jgi:hypothetical protein
MTKRNIIIAVGVIIVAGLWYAFRPELLFISKQVNEQFPSSGQVAAGPMTLAQGSFKSLAHETKGMVSIYQLADGKRTLRLTEFETSNGPDVHVYLTAAEVEKGSDAIKAAGFIDLGSMKGNKGDQNYDIPADVDLSKYKSVTIWCARFGVNFGIAPLALRKAKITDSHMGSPSPCRSRLRRISLRLKRARVNFVASLCNRLTSKVMEPTTKPGRFLSLISE